MRRLNIKQLRRREEKEAISALNTFIHAALGVFRLYLFILSTAQYPRPKCAQNPNFYQTQVNAVNRLVNGNEGKKRTRMPETSQHPPLTSARRMSIPTSTTPPANAGTKKGKKRTRMSDEESMLGSMNNWMQESLGYMEKMANAMGYEKDLSARRSRLPTELEKLNITLTQQFKLAAIIGEKDERVDLFLNTRDDLKQAWVEAVLDGHVFGPV